MPVRVREREVVDARLPQVHDGGELLDEAPVTLFGVAELALGPPPLGDLQRHELVRFLQLDRAGEIAELELVVRQAQLFLRQLLGRDVNHEPLPREGVRPLIADERGLVVDPHDPAVGGDHPVVARPRLACLAMSVVGGQLGLAVVRVEQLDPDVGLVEPLLPRVPEQLLDARVRIDRAPLVVGSHLVDDGGDPLDERAVAGVGDREVLLGLHACADVDHDALPVDPPAGWVADQHGVVVDPDVPSAGVDRAVLHVEGRAGLERMHPSIEDAFAVLGGDPLGPVGVRRRSEVRRVAEDLFDVRARVEELQVLLVRSEVRDRRELIDQRAMPRLGEPQRQLRLLLGGDVDHHALPADRVAAGVPQRRRAVVEPDRVAVRAQEPVFDVVRGVPLERRLPGRENPSLILRMDRPLPQVVVRVVRGLRIAKHRLHDRTDVDLRVLGQEQVHEDRGRELLDEGAVQGLRFDDGSPIDRAAVGIVDTGRDGTAGREPSRILHRGVA